ncbi:hypothetical protein ACSBR2_016660 [Camellia fascicularis]
MPLKNSAETKISCQERRGDRMGSWSDLVWIVHGRSLELAALLGFPHLGSMGKRIKFGGSIYDLSYIDVDKILQFSSTLGWHSLKVKDEVQMSKGLRWIPRHPETRKGVVSDEMLQGVENKHRSGDSRIGQPFKLLLNPWADKRQPGELKHLSSQRKRK